MDDGECMMNCMDYEVQCANPRWRPKKSFKEVVEKDMRNIKIIRKMLRFAVNGKTDHGYWRTVMTECVIVIIIITTTILIVLSSVIMTKVIARVHSVHVVNVEQPQTKQPDLGCESDCF